MDYLQYDELATIPEFTDRFKPYYKWITFNIIVVFLERTSRKVLNLIINGLPSISKIIHFSIFFLNVLNLIINGLPSILRVSTWNLIPNPRFKPYYKWITFNI